MSRSVTVHGDDVLHEVGAGVGADFSGVRLHHDAHAARRAREVDATAFTVGADVFFAEGAYRPDTEAGKRVLAHELVHTVQQGASPATAGSVVHEAAPAGVLQRQARPSSECRFRYCHPRPEDDLRTPDLPPLDEAWLARLMQPDEHFYHGTTWRVAQRIPGNVQAIGGGDFGQGFYTHHDADPARAAERARWEGCRLCRKLGPGERYAGVIRFDVRADAYRRLFDRRRTFGLTSTTQPDYAARQQEWIDFVSGPGRGREADPTYDPAHTSWRHQRVDPPPDQGYDLIEGPFYRGVEGLPGPVAPPRSAFDPYAEGTALPQQVVWNHQRALDVLNAAGTTLTQYDSDRGCRPVVPPVAVEPSLQSAPEDAEAAEAVQREMTGV